MQTPRQITALALCRVEQQEAWSNLALDAYFQENKLEPRDRAFCSALFYGVLSAPCNALEPPPQIALTKYWRHFI